MEPAGVFGRLDAFWGAVFGAEWPMTVLLGFAAALASSQNTANSSAKVALEVVNFGKYL